MLQFLYFELSKGMKFEFSYSVVFAFLYKNMGVNCMAYIGRIIILIFTSKFLHKSLHLPQNSFKT